MGLLSVVGVDFHKYITNTILLLHKDTKLKKLGYLVSDLVSSRRELYLGRGRISILKHIRQMNTQIIWRSPEDSGGSPATTVEIPEL